MNEIRFGTQLFYSQSYDFMRKKFIEANKENWDSIWLPDHLSGIPGAAIDDFLSLWPLFGSFAEISKEKTFGSCVTDPHRMHPAVLAQIATTIDHITGGKFILGMGAGEGMNLKAYNIPYDHALSKMSESIQLINQFWRKGKRITFKGKFYQTNKAVLLPKPTSEIPIWVASNGPKTIEMTGKIADGWLPLGVSTQFYKVGIEKIKTILQREGRDQSKFTFGVFNRVFLDDDEEKINEQVRNVKMAMLMQPLVIKELGYWKEGFDELFCDATGYKCEEISLLQVDREDIVKFDLNKLSTIIDHIPDDVVRTNIMFGTKEEITEKIQKYINLGAQYFVLEIQNGASSKNAPYTYWDVSRILSDEVILLFNS